MTAFDWKNKKIRTKEERKKLLQYWMSYSILGLAIFSMTFFGMCSSVGDTGGVAVIGGDAGRVAGEKIPDIEFRRMFQAAYTDWRNQNPEKKYNPQVDKLSERVLQQIVTSRVEYITGKNAGLTASEKEIIKSLQDVQYFKKPDGSFDKEAFKNYLRNNLQTEADFTQASAMELTQNKLSNLINGLQFVSDKQVEMEYTRRESKVEYEYIRFTPALIDGQIDLQDVKNFASSEANQTSLRQRFDQEKEKLNKKAEVKARHILIGFKEARSATDTASKRTKAEARKLAESLLVKAKDSKNDFAELAKQVTDEPSGKVSGGDLGWFTADKMVKEFSDAAFSLTVGDISNVIESPFGFHIIKVEGKKDAVDANFDEHKLVVARNMIREQKSASILDQTANEYLNMIKLNKKEIDAKFKKDGLKWETTGLVSLGSGFIPGFGADENLAQEAAKLKQPGQFLDKVVVSGENRFIIRLKQNIAANTQKFADEKDMILQRLKFQKGYQAKQAIVDAQKVKFEKNNRIKLSKKHLEMDKLLIVNNGE